MNLLRSLRAHWITAYATSAAFLAAALYAGLAVCQLKHMRIATEAATKSATVQVLQFEYAERPKIGANIRFTRPLLIDRDGLHLDVAMTFDNTGATVAVGTNIQYEFYPFENFVGPMPDYIRDRVCELAKSESRKWWLKPNRPHSKRAV